MRIVLAALVLSTLACRTTLPHPPAPVAQTPAPPSPPCNAGHTILNATLYVQSAAEFRAAARQTFRAARVALDEALADRTRVGALEETPDGPDQPPAIVLDADETVLDNTPYETRVIREGKTYDGPMWKQWTSEGTASAIPGAVDFLNYAKSRGVTVFYVTNRDEDERTGTRRNMEQLGFPFEADRETLLLRVDTSDKAPRRAQIAAQYRLLLLVGDDLNDFASMREKSWQERDELVTRMESWWGTRWFMIPNPMYGSWESAAIGSGGAPCERVERKVRVLR